MSDISIHDLIDMDVVANMNKQIEFMMDTHQILALVLAILSAKCERRRINIFSQTHKGCRISPRRQCVES